MIPNFNPNKWNREKIIDYVIGEQPLTDQQLEFLNYVEQLQQENKEFKRLKDSLLNALCLSRKKYKNDKQRYRRKYKKEHNILIKFEKWLKEQIIYYKDNYPGEDHGVYKDVLDKLQELKEGRNNGSNRYL